MARQATLLVADEIYFNLYGKAILHGLYNSDLVINSESAPAPQLIFYFIAETDIGDPFRSVAAEVALPGSTPIRQPLPVLVQHPPLEERTKIFVRWPMLIPAPVLRPGRIVAKVIHESGEIIVGAPWIVLNPAIHPAKTH